LLSDPRQPLEALRDQDQFSARGLVMDGVGETSTFSGQLFQVLGWRCH
jgi:hypothetical protein